ncbi:porin [Vibrio sp. T187]|uniref:porin n=1 Tax=Vibrio TaxID=662 RepID=UPI0010CA12C7|nr:MULTISPECIES: porin [Vibrio]MBW3697788.1 porin [Vibrio sp. T187]
MKKTLLAALIASTATSAFAVQTSSQNSKPAFEFDPVHKDQFSVSGSFGVGGYYDTKSNAFYDDWATALTVAVSYQNNRVLGYFETDLEANWTTDDKTNPFDVESDFNTDVDKAWLGFDTGYGIASYGWENDTALDKVDGAGDMTYEFGASAGDASDAFNVVKFQGSTAGVAYGISYFETADKHSDADKGINGYLGYEHKVFNIYAGYEERDEADFSVISLSGNANVGSITLGFNSWIDEGKNDEEVNTTDYKNSGYYLSSAYSLNDQLILAAGYGSNTTEENNNADIDVSYYNIAAMYTLNERADMGIDIKRDIDVESGSDEETYVFASAYYYF